MGTKKCAANGFAKMELDRDSRRGKYKGHIIQYWYHVFGYRKSGKTMLPMAEE
jgi:hypothetical protein